jgi:hypothetical protein
MAVDPDGAPVHDRLDAAWRILPEEAGFREQVLETSASAEGAVTCAWTPRRPLPHPDSWFETAWAKFREGKIYE